MSDWIMLQDEEWPEPVEEAASTNVQVMRDMGAGSFWSTGSDDDDVPLNTMAVVEVQPDADDTPIYVASWIDHRTGRVLWGWCSPEDEEPHAPDLSGLSRHAPPAEVAAFPVADISEASARQEAINLVVAERIRQVEEEGWTPDHDDAHGDGALAEAAAAYALASVPGGPWENNIDDIWPFAGGRPRPAHRSASGMGDLVKAGALILAEIERRQRAGEAGPDGMG